MSEQKLNFNEQGLLVPAEVIESDLDTIEKYLVTMFPKSKTRRLLFDNLVEFNQKLQSEVFPWYEQWVNGSFVTMKDDPMDVDVVTFIESDVFSFRTKQIDKISNDLFEKMRIDGYFVKVFPNGSSEYKKYLENYQYWQHLFIHNRGRGNKGFLKLIFENKII
jgi:hypothetical protein